MCAGKNCPKNNKNPGEKHRGEKEAALEARYAAWMQVALKAVYLAEVPVAGYGDDLYRGAGFQLGYNAVLGAGTGAEIGNDAIFYTRTGGGSGC